MAFNLISFLENLHQLYKAGVGKDRIFKTLSVRVSNPYLKEKYSEISKSNRYLYQDLSDIKYIPKYVLSLIKAGELSGKLEDVLQELINYLKNLKRIKTEYIIALIYPAILTFLGFIFLIFMTKKILPSILKTYPAKIDKLPEYNQIIIKVSQYIAKELTFLHFFIFCSLIIVIYLLLINIKEFRYIIDLLKIKIPLINRFYIDFNLALFYFILSFSLKSGMPLVEAFSVSLGSIENIYLKKELFSLYEKDIYLNQDIKSFFESLRYINENHLISILSSIESGNIDTTLFSLYKDLLSSLMTKLRILSIVLSVGILISISLFIGAMILAFYLTYFNSLFKSVEFNLIYKRI